MKKKHKHEFEQKKTEFVELKYIQCKICKKISFPNKPTPRKMRKKRIRYITKGAFGRNNGEIS